MKLTTRQEVKLINEAISQGWRFEYTPYDAFPCNQSATAYLRPPDGHPASESDARWDLVQIRVPSYLKRAVESKGDA